LLGARGVRTPQPAGMDLRALRARPGAGAPGAAPARAPRRAALPPPLHRARAAMPGSPRGGSPASTVSERRAPRALTLAPPAKAPQAPTRADAPAADAPAAGPSSAAPGAAADAAAGPAGALGAWWDALPSRYKVLFGAFMSFVICNMVGCAGGGAGAPGTGWAPSVWVGSGGARVAAGGAAPLTWCRPRACWRRAPGRLALGRHRAPLSSCGGRPGSEDQDCRDPGGPRGRRAPLPPAPLPSLHLPAHPTLHAIPQPPLAQPHPAPHPHTPHPTTPPPSTPPPPPRTRST
jgi:hypothetical protein